MGNPFERINPVREAISTYRDVNDIFRQERADTRAEEDRQYNRQRQAIADRRADDTHRVAMEQARNTELNNAIEAVKYQLSKAPHTVTKEQLDEISPYLPDPDSARAYVNAAADLNVAMDALASGDPEAGKKALASISQIAKNSPEVKSRKWKGYNFVQMDNATPYVVNNQLKGFFFDAIWEAPEMGPPEKGGGPLLDDQGKPIMKRWKAPFTVGRSADDNDRLKVFTINEDLPKILGNAQLLDGYLTALEAQQVRLGNSEPSKKRAAIEKSKKFGAALEGVTPEGTNSAEQIKVVKALTDAEIEPSSAIALAKILKPDKDEKEVKPIFKTKKFKNRTEQEFVSYDNGKTWKEFDERTPMDAPNKPDKEKTPPKEGPTFRSIHAPNVLRKDGTRGPGIMTFDMSNPDHVSKFKTWMTSGEDGVYEVYPGQEQGKDIVTGDTVKTKVAPNTGKKGQAVSAAKTPRKGEPDLETAKAYLKKYGSKQKAMEAWSRGE